MAIQPNILSQTLLSNRNIFIDPVESIAFTRIINFQECGAVNMLLQLGQEYRWPLGHVDKGSLCSTNLVLHMQYGWIEVLRI